MAVQSLYGKGDWGRGYYSATRYADLTGAAGAAFNTVANGRLVRALFGAPSASFDVVAAPRRVVTLAGVSGVTVDTMAVPRVALKSPTGLVTLAADAVAAGQRVVRSAAAPAAAFDAVGAYVQGQPVDGQTLLTCRFDVLAGGSVSVRAGGLAVMLSDGGLVATLALPLRGTVELVFDAAAAASAQVAGSGAADIGLVVAAHAAVAFEVIWVPAPPPPDWASLTTSLYGAGDYGVGLYSAILFDVEAPPWDVIVRPPSPTAGWQVVGETTPDWSGVTISYYGAGDYGRGLYSHIEDQPSWQTVYRPPTPVDRALV